MIMCFDPFHKGSYENQDRHVRFARIDMARGIVFAANCKRLKA
jgi:hypothetical protein